MPRVSASTSSTFVAAASVASKLVPGGIFWSIDIVGAAEVSNRFVLSSVVPAMVATKMATAATRVMALWSMASLRTGRYKRCSRVTSAGSRWPTWPLERTNVATTGTTVSATSRLASRAKVTVIANGRKNSEARPWRNPRGRKTATVVRVLAVIARATSRVAP